MSDSSKAHKKVNVHFDALIADLPNIQMIGIPRYPKGWNSVIEEFIHSLKKFRNVIIWGITDKKGRLEISVSHQNHGGVFRAVYLAQKKASTLCAGCGVGDVSEGICRDCIDTTKAERTGTWLDSF